MGHYCMICGRTRANEKFSGKGRKNHVCKNCSGKTFKKAIKSSLDRNDFISDNRALLEDMNYYNNLFIEDDFEGLSLEYENDEELPF